MQGLVAAKPGRSGPFRGGKIPLSMNACPVCTASNPSDFATIDERRYLRCHHCLATFLDHAQLPNRETEKSVYDLHQNDPDDPGYRRFLGRLAGPLLDRLEPASRGLDYGCGPGPALAAMLAEAGHQVAQYDPIYRPDNALLGSLRHSCSMPHSEALNMNVFVSYDFITCTEVVEHFHHPAEEFRRLDAMLKPGGWLAIMTIFQTDDARFAGWHYRRDPTHVVFYRPHTFEALGRRHGWQLDFPDRNIVFARKLIKSRR